MLKNRTLLRFFYKIRLFEFIFFIHAFLWFLTHKRPEGLTTKKICKIFYHDFLKVPKNNCKIVNISKTILITHCSNPCPILNLSKLIGIDTREVCKRVSEGPCKYFLKRLHQRIDFKRDYKKIRPYTDYCRETIRLPL